MPRAKRDEIFRHETTTDDEEELFDSRESGFVVVNPGAIAEATVRRGKGKRSLEDMMASMPNELAQSTYALERIAAIEDQIEKVLSLCTPEARKLVLKQRPMLKRYAPEE
jgi:hypothetical protein